MLSQIVSNELGVLANFAANDCQSYGSSSLLRLFCSQTA
jgi:hypothetical protein